MKNLLKKLRDFFNFRKKICRKAKKDGWLYRKADCKRYEPKPVEPDLVEVEVCLKSGFKASPNCKSSALKKLDRKYAEVMGRCTDCKPEETVVKAIPGPPWFGLSVYQIIRFARNIIGWYLDQLVINGGNILEVIPAISWAGNHIWQPYVRKPGKLEPDKYPETWDLELFDPMVMEKWDWFFSECGKRNIAVVFRWLDFCSMKREVDYHKYCFRAATQRVEFPEGDPRRLAGGNYGEPIRKYYYLYMEKFTGIAAKHGVKVFGQAMNEADYIKGEGETDAIADAKVVELHKWFFANMQFLGIPFDRILASTSRAFNEVSKYAKWMEIHGVSSPNRLMSMINLYSGMKLNLWPNGDGPDPYALGERGDHEQKRMPNDGQASLMGEMIRRYNLPGWIGLNRPVEDLDGSQVLERAVFHQLQRMREGYGE